MSFTLSELKTAIQDYTENTETSFVSNLDNFIKATEDKIFRAVDLEYFRKNVTSALSTGDQYLSVPTDFLAPFSLRITTAGSEKFLLFKDVNYVQTYTPDSTTTGLPKYYSRFDVDNLIVSPTPDSNYAVELHYFYQPDSLTAGADDGTTWLSTNAPFALLYGSIFEAYNYMKGEADMLKLYNDRFSEQLSRLKDLGEARENSDAYRRGLPDIRRT